MLRYLITLLLLAACPAPVSAADAEKTPGPQSLQDKYLPPAEREYFETNYSQHPAWEKEYAILTISSCDLLRQAYQLVYRLSIETPDPRELILKLSDLALKELTEIEAIWRSSVQYNQNFEEPLAIRQKECDRLRTKEMTAALQRLASLLKEKRYRKGSAMLNAYATTEKLLDLAKMPSSSLIGFQQTVSAFKLELDSQLKLIELEKQSLQGWSK